MDAMMDGGWMEGWMVEWMGWDGDGIGGYLGDLGGYLG